MKSYFYKNPNDCSMNWGDIIAPDIISHFSKSTNIQETNENNDSPKLVSVGSVMNAVKPNDMVWGTGIITPGVIGNAGLARIFAVRGPKTRDELLKHKIECPEIYGDPALLYPQIYTPENIEKTHEWGVIAHYVDKYHPGVIQLQKRGFKVINILAGKKQFVDQLHRVEKVLSSSLHGLIAADAYGIPNARIRFSNKVVGGDFKFMDYALSVNRNDWRAIDGNTDQIQYPGYNSVELSTQIEWDSKKLLDAAPWVHSDYTGLFY